jgi:hypothetical protein
MAKVVSKKPVEKKASGKCTCGCGCCGAKKTTTTSKVTKK